MHGNCPKCGTLFGHNGYRWYPLCEHMLEEEKKLKEKKNEGKIMNQEHLFNEWTDSCGKLLLLNSFIQNDFDKMLQDGSITKDNIKKGMVYFNEAYSEIMSEISTIKSKIEKFVEVKTT